MTTNFAGETMSSAALFRFLSPTLMIVVACVGFLTPKCLGQVEIAGSTNRRLADFRQAGELCHVKILVRSESKVRLKDPEGTEREFPLKASGKLEFRQRMVSLNPDRDLAARHYQVAESEVTGGTETESIRLAEDRRTIKVQCKSAEITRAALDGALSHPETELLRTPGDLMAAYGLLPGETVEVGQRWQPADEAIQRLLNFQTVGVNETKIEVVKIDRGLATMKLTGSVRGMIDGAVSETRLKGDLRYDLNWQRINWLHLILDDNREKGPSAPAVRSAVEMRMLVSPTNDASALDTSAIASLGQSNREDAPVMLRYASKGFRLLHEPAWVPIADDGPRAIFRLVDRDEAIGQCHIARLANEAPGKQTGLEEFQRDVQSALGERFGRMVAANQTERPDGVRVLRAIAEGTIEEVPIRWIYYHLSNQQGVRASVVFTVDASHLKRFSNHDEAITSSLTFTDAASTPAAQPQTAAESAPQRG